MEQPTEQWAEVLTGDDPAEAVARAHPTWELIPEHARPRYIERTRRKLERRQAAEERGNNGEGSDNAAG